MTTANPSTMSDPHTLSTPSSMSDASDPTNPNTSPLASTMIKPTEQELQRRVKNCLNRFELTAVEPVATEREIHLSGNVPTANDRSLATAVVRTVPGVLTVQNDIVVLPASEDSV
ncbi:BON domain-containing protein [Neorhodopirellula lusitana]|uniref:BON domain-containing protein n=1 Tax=Neorhodopirellula lusitana TaxID=445327 RepID=A0ABY1Q6Z5_9BACT|nr:BON domain-containing protein [Neorhodopirellula lusitana]SMP61642.1 BON domain-containing protein [Neorhodopirellula lusitana]